MEFVSALCDGETIPREAAEHIGACKACQAVLTEYLEIGTELRRVACLAVPEAVRPLNLQRKRGRMRAIWRKGWESMRIPRFAFATLLVGVVALSLSLALAKVHAHGAGNVVMLTIAANHGLTQPCPLSTVDKKNAQCDFGGGVGSGYVSFRIRLLSKEDGHVKLGVRAGYFSRGDTRGAADMPEKEYSFEPGETLRIDVAGFGPINVTGEWMDYMPYFGQMNLENNLEPAPDEIRVISPVLLKARKVAIDFGGSSVSATGKGSVDWFYVPGDGLYEFSLSPLPGAIPGHAENNRLTFTIDGQALTLLTGAPIARGEQVWVLHSAHVKPAGPDFGHAVIGTEQVNHLIPREKTTD
jgi:hypothetical protein